MTDMRTGLLMAKAFDAHVHLRQDRVLKHVLPFTTRDCDAALIMPNPEPIVWDAASVEAYREEIMASAPAGFRPLMTIYLTERTTPEVILRAKKVGAVAAKYYPHGGTMNSEHGLTPENFLKRDDWFEALQEADMVLCIHAEHPRYPYSQREQRFLKLFVGAEIAERFPKLRIVIEHVSSRVGLAVVGRYENVAATVTAHHLFLTHDDVYGNHHHMCMPVAKTEEDRLALIEAVVSGKRRDLFFGSDSAPHTLSVKSQPETKPGIFTAPVALALLAKAFTDQKRGRLSNLPDFVSTIGCEFYRIPESKQMIELVPEEQFVTKPAITFMKPDRDIDDEAPTDPPPPDGQLSDPITTFFAGQVINWSVRYR